MRTVDVEIDVTAEVGLDRNLATGVTICLPDNIPDRPIICFAFPGGGYNRNYFVRDLVGRGDMSQAEVHTSRGWIFVAADHLGCGGSTPIEDMTLVTWQHLVDANEATVRGVLELLGGSTAHADLPVVLTARTVGLAQSMGAALLIVQQGQRHTFDAVSVLGWSAIHAVSWLPPNSTRTTPTYFPRGTDVGQMTRLLHTQALPEMATTADGLPAAASGFHFDDVPREIVSADLIDYPARRGNLPFWATEVVPPSSMTMMSPGAVAPEAAMIRTPVFVGVGERDVTPRPLAEPTAYLQSNDVTVYVQPRMGHMHNFASTRHAFWNRIHRWAEGALANAESTTLPNSPKEEPGSSDESVAKRGYLTSGPRSAEIGVVLVHGACHGSWCWEDVVEPLGAQGFRVDAVDLPLTSLIDDSDVVRLAVKDLRREVNRVLVVGHSYGGVVLSAGGHEADALIFCAASMPDAGQTASDVVPQLTTPELEASLALYDDGLTFGLDPVRAVPAFYNACSPDQVQSSLKRLRPMHFACMNEVVERPAWREVPSSYIVCTRDRAMAPDYQVNRARFLDDFVTLDCDHSLFYSATEGLVARIIDIAQRMSSTKGTTTAPTPTASSL